MAEGWSPSPFRPSSHRNHRDVRMPLGGDPDGCGMLDLHSSRFLSVLIRPETVPCHGEEMAFAGNGELTVTGARRSERTEQAACP